MVESLLLRVGSLHGAGSRADAQALLQMRANRQAGEMHRRLEGSAEALTVAVQLRAESGRLRQMKAARETAGRARARTRAE